MAHYITRVCEPVSESESVEEIACREIMSAPPVTGPPTMTAFEAAKLMVEKGIGSIIVVDDNGSLLGIVTKTDLIRGVVAEGRSPGDVYLSSIMTRDPYYVTPDTLVSEAAEIMGYYGVGHLPVVDTTTGKVVGVVSMRDIVRLAPHYIEKALLASKRRNE